MGYFYRTNDEELKYQDVLNYSGRNRFHMYYNTVPFFPSKMPLKLHGCPLKIGYKLWPPFVINVNAAERYAGYEFDFLLIVRNYLNCTYRYRQFPRRVDYLPTILVYMRNIRFRIKSYCLKKLKIIEPKFGHYDWFYFCQWPIFTM